MKKGVLRNFTNSQENTCARVSFLILKEHSVSVVITINFQKYGNHNNRPFWFSQYVNYCPKISVFKVGS